MFPHLDIEVLKLAIEKKNGNPNDAVMLLFNESDVKKLQDEVDKKK